MLVYYFQRRHIPKLVFDGIWKKKGVIGIDYFLKVKREKGEGRAEGVLGLVGIKDKLELTSSRWTLSNTIADIIRHDYLVLFRIVEHKGNKIITFPTIYPLPQPDDNNLHENNRYNQYEKDKLIVEIEAIRGRISQRQFKKKIKDIVKEAKQIPP